MTIVGKDLLEFESRPSRLTADPFRDSTIDSTVRQVVLEPGPRTPHLHPHTEEVYFVVSGRGRIWLDGVQHPVEEGSWVRIPPRTPHATLAYEEMTLVAFFPHPSLDDNIEELDQLLEIEEETP
ncbi:MAG: cupin domain-containing protein [Acidimicrobiia bacterium]|nr:cupin domain-containing protein [Acidimicrobiia bacterium]